MLNLILNAVFILLWGPWGVTPSSFLSLLLVFLLRAWTTRGLLRIDFHAGWLALNLGLILAEIWCLMNLDAWVLPVAVLTAGICVINLREVYSLAQKLLGRLLHRKGA